jgi:hypothetical protein
MVKTQDDRTDDVVEAGTESATRDNATGERGRIEEQPLARASAFHRRGLIADLLEPLELVEGRGIEYPLLIANKSHT